MTVHLHHGDLPEGLTFGDSVAIDTETMGLKVGRDRLCVVQLSAGDGDAHVVHFPEPVYDAPRLAQLLADASVTKLFHFGRFDIAALDTLVLATPRANVEQSVGRIMRGGAANEPLVVDVVDGGAYCARLASKRLSLYRSAGYQLDDVGGGGDGSDGGDVDGDAASDADEDAVADTGAGAADDGEAAEGAGQGSAGAVVGAAGARGGSGDVRVLIDGFRFRPQVHAQGACAAGSTHSAGGLVRSKYFAC